MANSSPIEIQKDLKGLDYPANRQDLIEKARSNGANKYQITILENLKEDAFANPAEVSKAVGQLV